MLSVLREHKFEISLFSLAYAVVFLPAGIWTFLTALLLKSTVVLPKNLILRYLLLLCAAMAISGPGAAGLYRLARNWIRNSRFVHGACFKALSKTAGNAAAC